MAGFLTGFIGNVLFDLIIGHGTDFLFSWSLGNGLLGLTTGLLLYRRQHRLEGPGHVFYILFTIALANLVFVIYSVYAAAVIYSMTDLSYALRYQLLPIYNINMLVSLLVLPALLLLFNRIRRSFPVKIFFLLFYFSVAVMGSAGLIYFYQHGFSVNTGGLDPGRSEGLLLLDTFNHWALVLLGYSFLILLVAKLLTKTILHPLTQLEKNVYALLNNDDSIVVTDALNMMSRREDELALLSYSIMLLSERLWEAERLFILQFRKKMTFIKDSDSIADIYLVGLASLFNKDMLAPENELPDMAPDGTIRGIDAVSLAVTAAGLRELANTYTLEATRRTLGAELAFCPSFKSGQHGHLALAVDLKLLFKGMLKTMDFSLPLNEKLAWHLLFHLNNYIGQDQQVIGYVTEPDIITRLGRAWKEARKVGPSPIDSAMTQAMSIFGITGYSIKRKSSLLNFDPNFSFYYGHSSLRHLKQVIGILIRESIQAKLSLEIKRSCFLFKDDWDLQADSGTLLTSPAGNILHCDEFDLVMEFADGDGRTLFKGMIEKHMHIKDRQDNPLLHQSWVTPLYFGHTPSCGDNRIDQIIIKSDEFLAHTFVSTDKTESIIDWFVSGFPELQSTSRPAWVYKAFYEHILQSK